MVATYVQIRQINIMSPTSTTFGGWLPVIEIAEDTALFIQLP
jgi:hypothetical protein